MDCYPVEVLLLPAKSFEHSPTDSSDISSDPTAVHQIGAGEVTTSAYIHARGRHTLLTCDQQYTRSTIWFDIDMTLQYSHVTFHHVRAHFI